MKKLLFVLVLFYSGLAYSQAEAVDTIKYKFYIQNSGTEQQLYDDNMIEGASFNITPQTLPSSLASCQDLYNALVGSTLGLELGSLDRNIQLNIVIGNLNPNGQLVVGGQPLFLYMKIDVVDLKTGEWYPEDSSFYFLNGKGAILTIPVTEAFLAFCAKNGIDINQGISFGYEIVNPDGSPGWTSAGLTWSVDQTQTPWIITVKLIHFSKFGGGGKTLTTDIESEKVIPDQFNLLQNYPNPFNPSTVIRYDLPEAGNVTLKIYNSLGKEITTLVSGYNNAGQHSVEFSSRDLSSGTYFYTINFNGKLQTRKMLLIK